MGCPRGRSARSASLGTYEKSCLATSLAKPPGALRRQGRRSGRQNPQGAAPRDRQPAAARVPKARSREDGRLGIASATEFLGRRSLRESAGPSMARRAGRVSVGRSRVLRSDRLSVLLSPCRALETAGVAPSFPKLRVRLGAEVGPRNRSTASGPCLEMPRRTPCRRPARRRCSVRPSS